MCGLLALWLFTKKYLSAMLPSMAGNGIPQCLQATIEPEFLRWVFSCHDHVVCAQAEQMNGIGSGSTIRWTMIQIA